MRHSFRKAQSLITSSLVVAAMLITLFGSMDTAHAQVRRILLEEFTGAWCGWCPGGELQIQELEAAYPGQVFAISYHNDQGSPANDMMTTSQGDTIQEGISALSSATAVTSFPNGWLARTAVNGSWNTTPQSASPWIDTISHDGLVEQMLGQKAVASVSIDSISYQANSEAVTARVNVTFNEAASGDFRFNLAVVEDSVTGTGAGYDQHNYYYHSASFVGPYYNLGNPYYISQNGQTEEDGSTIPGWNHMQVFRYAPSAIWGDDGQIPSKVTAGSHYTLTYTFLLPTSVNSAANVKLIGFVSQYSASTLASNSVLDVDEEPLLGAAPKYLIASISVAPQNQYGTATSNGTTQVPMIITNNTPGVGSDGKDSVTLSLSVNSASLPTGWSATISPSTVTVKNGGTTNATVSVIAPEQSAFVGIPVTATPIDPGYLTSSSSGSAYLLSSNTTYGLYVPNGSSSESAMLAGIPDTMQLHTAVMPLTTDIMSNYDYTQFPVIILNNIPILDCATGFGEALGLGVDPSIQMINDELSAGNKIFINSDDALGYAFDASDGYYSQYTQYTETDAVQSFYQQMGIDFTKTVRNWNTTSGVLTPFSIKGEAGDSVGNGISATDEGGFLSEIYSLDSAFTESFYISSAKNVIGSRYVDSATGSKVVYLGFGLSELTSQSEATTIANHSIQWLLGSNSAAAVNPVTVASTGITASPNPFHGSTVINYTAAPGEENVSLAAYDVLGREVAVLPTHDAGNNTFTATLDGNALSSGTYVIIAHSSKGSSQVQVVNQ